MITVDHENFEKAKKELEGIIEKTGPALNVVTAKLINNATREAKKEVIRRITEEYYIDKKPIKEAVSISTAKPGNLEAKITNNRKRNKDTFSLGRFKVDVSSSGPLKVAQSKSGGLIELKRAFVSEKRNQPGNMHVFRRSGPNRYPLNVERSYSLGGMIESEKLSTGIEEVAEEYIDKKFPEMVDQYFEKEGI